MCPSATICGREGESPGGGDGSGESQSRAATNRQRRIEKESGDEGRQIKRNEEGTGQYLQVGQFMQNRTGMHKVSYWYRLRNEKT